MVLLNGLQTLLKRALNFHLLFWSPMKMASRNQFVNRHFLHVIHSGKSTSRRAEGRHSTFEAIRNLLQLAEEEKDC